MTGRTVASMNARGIVLSVLIASALSLSAAQAQSPTPRPTPSKSGQAHNGGKPPSAQQSQSAPSPSVVITPPAPILDGKTGEDGEQGKREAAQYRLNRLQTWFNGCLALFTAALVVVGGLQAYRLRQTLDHMRESSEKELRAYVHISGAMILNSSQPANREAQVVIRNFGRTPAYKVTFWLHTWIKRIRSTAFCLGRPTILR